MNRSSSDLKAQKIGLFTCERLIGRGSFATVWKASNSDTIVAIKVIPTFDMSKKLKLCLDREIQTLFKIRHPHVVELHDSLDSFDDVCLITEYCSGGELTQFRRTQGDASKHSINEIMVLIRQVIDGIHHLHEMGYVHRDIKPQNILLNDAGVVKIADFGFACDLQLDDMASTMCGSPLYMAPEILLHKAYDNTVDIWSLGVLMYELLCRHPPFSGINCQDLLRHIKRDWKTLPFPDIPHPISDLLRQMLMPWPNKRITSFDLKQHCLLFDTVSRSLSIKSSFNAVCAPGRGDCFGHFLHHYLYLFPADIMENYAIVNIGQDVVRSHRTPM